MGLFHFSSSESSIFWNIKKIIPGSLFPKYKKSFLLRKHRKSFRSLRFLKYKKFSLGRFLLFLRLRLKSAGLHSWKYKKCFFLRKYNKSFLLRKKGLLSILELESSISGNITIFFWGGRGGWFFFGGGGRGGGGGGFLFVGRGGLGLGSAGFRFWKCKKIFPLRKY